MATIYGRFCDDLNALDTAELDRLTDMLHADPGFAREAGATFVSAAEDVTSDRHAVSSS